MHHDLAREALARAKRGQTKLIMVGDALMAPYELLHAGGALDLGEEDRVEGIVWFMMLAQHFERSAWLNPEPETWWHGNTIEYVRGVFDMFPLTVDGIGAAAQHLTRAARGALR